MTKIEIDNQCSALIANAKIERVKGNHYVADIMDSAAAALRELEKDRERLDWIDANAVVNLAGDRFSVKCDCYIKPIETRTLRTIIDAALKEPQ